MVFHNKCKKCNYICIAIYFQQNFYNWTSGNKNIDKIIQDTQLSAHRNSKAIEWIPYDRFCNIKYIEEGEYRANWVDGNIIDWNNNNQNLEEDDQNVKVELRLLLSNPKNITLEFVNKV